MLYEIFSTMLALVFVLSIPVVIVSGALCLFSTKIDATKWLKYSGITCVVSLIMIYGCMAYEKTLEEQDMVAQLQAENAELNKQIEAIKTELDTAKSDYDSLSNSYDRIMELNAQAYRDIEALEEQLNSVEETEESNDEVAVAEETEEHEEATNSNNNLSNAYGTVGHSSKYDAYYHDYSDCTFIQGKGAQQLTSEQVLNRRECKCVYAGRFWN